MTLSSGGVFPQRAIIAIDLDCFYVAAERVLDPSLIGKAIGIQQKYILATASYEARALGISKLQNVKEAKKMVPDLLLINGEDLTYYRRFSRAITRLVKGIVWDRQVERLGMDELFCEVTEMCRAHLEDLKKPSTSAQSNKVFFNLSKDRSSTSNGFFYDPASSPSLVIPAPSQAADAQYSPLFAAAAHLAAHIRQRIHDELGFTTSAGIAHNKILAKLVASLNKPALQTTWNPEIRRWKEEQATFLAGFEAGKIQGVGHAICKTIRSHIESKPGAEVPCPTLTCALIRSECTEADFVSWFGSRQGSRLWGLLYGEDNEPVNASPEYPLQISVENSHYGITSFKQAVDELGSLALHLLQRLKEDLTEGIDDNPVIAAREDRKGKGKENSRWAQYPTTLRLTIRQGYDRSRESKSTPFPIDAIEEDQPIELRAEKLTKGILASLLKKLLRTNEANASCRITILNVCAANFSKTKPNQTIASALSRRPVQSREIDLTLLPSDDVEDSKPTIRALPASEPILIEDEEEEENEAGSLSLARTPEEGEAEDDLLFVGEDTPALFTCKLCGSRLFTFSAAAHRAYHESESRKESTKGNGKPANKGKSAKAKVKLKSAMGSARK